MVALWFDLIQPLYYPCKASGLATLASGAYCPTLDKPEQAMDILQEAVKNGRLTLGESLAVLVDVGAERIFDKVKNK